MFPLALSDYIMLFNLYSRIITNYVNNGRDMEITSGITRAATYGLRSDEMAENMTSVIAPKGDSHYDQFCQFIINGYNNQLYRINFAIMVENDKYFSYSKIVMPMFKDSAIDIYSVFNPVDMSGIDKYIAVSGLFEGLFGLMHYDHSCKKSYFTNWSKYLVAELFVKILYNIDEKDKGEFMLPSDMVMDMVTDGKENHYAKKIISNIIDEDVDYTGKFVKLPINKETLKEKIISLVSPR